MGDPEGTTVGLDGEKLGDLLGDLLGACDGETEGDAEGLSDGDAEGANVEHAPRLGTFDAAHEFAGSGFVQTLEPSQLQKKQTGPKHTKYCNIVVMC